MLPGLDSFGQLEVWLLLDLPEEQRALRVRRRALSEGDVTQAAGRAAGALDWDAAGFRHGTKQLEGARDQSVFCVLLSSFFVSSSFFFFWGGGQQRKHVCMFVSSP